MPLTITLYGFADRDVTKIIAKTVPEYYQHSIRFLYIDDPVAVKLNTVLPDYGFVADLSIILVNFDTRLTTAG